MTDGFWQQAEARRWLTPLARLLHRRPVVLFLHGAVARRQDPILQALHHELPNLERVLRTLQRHHPFIGLEQLLAGFADPRQWPANALVLTLDDGYRNNLTTVAPLLADLGIPMTVFVTTRPVEEGGRFPSYVARLAMRFAERPLVRLSPFAEPLPLSEETWFASYRQVVRVLKSAPLAQMEALLNELRHLLKKERWDELDAWLESDRPMTWDEVVALHRQGAAIGSHGHDHCVLHAAQPTEEIHRQLALSQRLLIEHLGQCDTLALPNGQQGDFDARTIQMAVDLGYRLVATTLPGMVRDLPLLPRLFLGEDPEEMLAVVAWSFRRRQ